MSVGLVLVTHAALGTALISVVEGICGPQAKSLHLVSIPSDLKPQDLGRYADRVRDAILEYDVGDGVLVLTDLFGSTPDNLARHFAGDGNTRVVSGVNLPMLLRVLNYAQQPLEALTGIALEGGRDGVLDRSGHDF